MLKAMILHGYWRSSASYRVRIALGLKGIAVTHRAVNLKSGDHLLPAHGALNTQPFVPILELAGGAKLTQSAAILDYLEEAYPDSPLLPDDAILRARIRAASQIISADIAPIQNLRLLKYIKNELDGDAQIWARHWISEGFKSLETIAVESDSKFLLTDKAGYFECFLIPQIYNARRFDVDMAAFPRLVEIDAKCQALPAFDAARPENKAEAT
jgi:maleylacetoacetate isomerase